MRRRWWSVVALLAVAGSDDAPVACGCGLDGDWPEAPSKAPPDWLRVPRQSSAWAVTMVLALPACRGAPARSLREASACGPRDACVFDALKRSGDRRGAQLAEPPPPGNATDDWADWAVYAAARRRFAELLDAAGASPACARALGGGGGAPPRARAARDAAAVAAAPAARPVPRRAPYAPFAPSKRWAFLGDAAPWAARRDQRGRRRRVRGARGPLRRAARATIAGGRLFATLPADGALAMAYSRAEWNRLPVFLGAFLEIARFPALPVDFLFLLMDVPGVLDASTSPPVFAEARLRRAPPDRRHWLLPSFDTSRLEGGDVGDAAPPAARERSGAFWRGTVHAFTGYSVEEMVARRAYVHNLASRLDGRGNVVDALAEPVAASLQFSGGEGNARRWAVTTACDAGDDRLDVAAAEVAVEVEASGATDRAVSGDPAAAAARAVAAADGPTGITLRNYGFADHGDVCAKEAFLYLDGISTSNGLKYYGACGGPVILDADAAYEDLITAAWPAHAAAAHDPGATLRDKVDYVGADGAGAAAFCASVARAVAWLRAHAADATAMGARTRGAMLAVGSARAALEYLREALWPTRRSAGTARAARWRRGGSRDRRGGDAAVRNAYAELQVLLLEDRDADATELRRLFSPAAAADGLYPRSGACAAFPRPAAAAGARAPVVVAGQGGSGSRSVVELLRACGVEMNGVDGGEDDASSADRRLRARACALDTPQNP
ncbi:hypothetical protein JL720_7249 [Aureococcus anophagefferens]|nr:hypothetical protein JL720_7249 [Aureococcus anophagefferens]